MRTILVLALACWGCDSGDAPSRASRPSPTPAPTTAAEPPAAPAPPIHVRVAGAGKPMILIAGLGCSDEVWRGAEARFTKDWELHMVTIAGFAGTPPIEPPLLDSVRTALLAYIDDHQLDRPVIVGHSLGAMMALWVAGSAPGKTGPVVALDGAPYGAALADPAATPDKTRPRAEALRARASAVADDQRRAQARFMFAPMVTDPKDLDWLLGFVAKSDAATIGQAMYELMTTDARPQAAAITSPVLLMVAGDHFDGEDDVDLSPWQEQLAAIADHAVVVVPKAKHFVMIDEPDFVYDEMSRFLAAR